MLPLGKKNPCGGHAIAAARPFSLSHLLQPGGLGSLRRSKTICCYSSTVAGRKSYHHPLHSLLLEGGFRISRGRWLYTSGNGMLWFLEAGRKQGSQNLLVRLA